MGLNGVQLCFLARERCSTGEKKPFAVGKYVDLAETLATTGKIVFFPFPQEDRLLPLIWSTAALRRALTLGPRKNAFLEPPDLKPHGQVDKES